MVQVAVSVRLGVASMMSEEGLGRNPGMGTMEGLWMSSSVQSVLLRESRTFSWYLIRAKLRGESGFASVFLVDDFVSGLRLRSDLEFGIGLGLGLGLGLSFCSYTKYANKDPSFIVAPRCRFSRLNLLVKSFWAGPL